MRSPPHLLRRFLACLAVAALGFLGAIGSGAMRPATAQEDLIGEFRETLGAYGQWVDHPRWGAVWIPAGVPPEWRPYRTGHWAYTDEWGWYWVADEDWGWITYHYGRWVREREFGWVWVPGNDWSPAWVSWRWGDEAVGWLPMPPDEIVAEVEAEPDAWLFVAPADIVAPAIAVVVLPPPRVAVFFSRTVIVNQTIVVRSGGRVVVTNPGVRPAFIAARIGRPIQVVAIQPHVVRGTVGVTGAIVGRPGPGREVIRVQPNVIRPSASAAPPTRFRAGQPPGADAPAAWRRAARTTPGGTPPGPGTPKGLPKTNTTTTTTTPPPGAATPALRRDRTPPTTTSKPPDSTTARRPPATEIRRPPPPPQQVHRPPPPQQVHRPPPPQQVQRPPPPPRQQVRPPPPPQQRQVQRPPPSAQKKCAVVNGKQVCR